MIMNFIVVILRVDSYVLTSILQVSSLCETCTNSFRTSWRWVHLDR